MDDLNKVQVLVVGGGGAGGQDAAGGGGGGGVVYESDYSVEPGSTVPVLVGAGGSRPTNAGTQGTGGAETETIDLPSYFSIPGIYKYTAKPGTYSIKIWGAGGGGSSYSGGAGGACIVKTNLVVNETTEWTVFVGEGGTARNYSDNDLELGGVIGYQSGGTGANELSAYNADFIAAPLVNTYTFAMNDGYLGVKKFDVVNQYWLDNRVYSVFDTRAIYRPYNSTGRFSLRLIENYRLVGPDSQGRKEIIPSDLSPRCLIEPGIDMLYLDKLSSEYKFFRSGNLFYIRDAAHTKNLCRINLQGGGFTPRLVFRNGYVTISLDNQGTMSLQIPNGAKLDVPDGQFAVVDLIGRELPLDFRVVIDSVSDFINNKKGSGGGGGASSALTDNKGLRLVAGGGGGAGGFYSTLGTATGGGTGVGEGGTVQDAKFGSRGGFNGESETQPVVKVQDPINLSAWLNNYGVWPSQGNYFEKTIVFNQSESIAVTMNLSSSGEAYVYVDNNPVAVIVSKIFNFDALPSDWGTRSLQSKVEWLNSNRVPQSVLTNILGYTNEMILALQWAKPLKYDGPATGPIDRKATATISLSKGYHSIRIVASSNSYGLGPASVGFTMTGANNVIAIDLADPATYPLISNGTGGGGGGGSCQHPLSMEHIFPGDWYTYSGEQKIKWYNDNKITQDVLNFYGITGISELQSLGYSQPATGYVQTTSPHKAGGGKGGQSVFGDANHYVGENGKTTDTLALPGNQGDLDYTTSTGTGGSYNSKGGSGRVVIIHTALAGGSGTTTGGGNKSSNGGNSSFGKLVALGGGGGAGSASGANASNGGSGGGATSNRLAGSGTAGQGNNGGSGSTQCYDIDMFVSAKKGNFSVDVFKQKALNIMPLYTSNSAYTVPDLGTRYGLYRFPDIEGLAYWTNESLTKNWTITSVDFLKSFFKTAATSTYGSDATRILTGTKTQDTTSLSGCGFRDGSNLLMGGGGGGAGSVGNNDGRGGNGIKNEITGTAVFYGGGGGGTNQVNYPAAGGAGGGGTNGGYQSESNNGLPNTGGGGSAYSGSWGGAGNGGSGVVIVKYPSPQRATGGLITETSGYVLHRFINPGPANFNVSKRSIPEPPPPVEVVCDGSIALGEFYAGGGIYGNLLVREGTVGYPENIRTPIPRIPDEIISIKNFYGAKTGEYSIVGVDPNRTDANVSLWQQRTQVFFKVTSIKETERLYWTIEPVDTNYTFDPQIYPAQSVGNYKAYVNTSAQLIILDGPYRGRVSVSRSGPTLAFTPDPLVTEIVLDEFGNYFGKPDEVFLFTGNYTYTFTFPIRSNYTYTGTNTRIWQANILPAPAPGSITPTLPPILVPFPTTTTTTTTIRQYPTLINTVPYVGSNIALCSYANVNIIDAIPGGGVAGTIYGPPGSLTNGTGQEAISPFNLGITGGKQLGNRRYVVPGVYRYEFAFSAPEGSSIVGNNIRTFRLNVLPGISLQVVNESTSNTFVAREQVKVKITGGNDDTVTWSGPTTGSVNLGPDGQEIVTLLEQNHELPANNYTWKFTVADGKTCNDTEFKLNITPPPPTTTTTTTTTDPPGPACNTDQFNQTGGYDFDGLGPKGMLMYDVTGSGDFAAFQNDIGTVRGTNSARYTEKAYGNNTFGYSENTHWGLAAVHAGIVTTGQTKLIQIKSLGIKSNFPGSSANGITTQQRSEASCAYQILAYNGNPRINVCPINLNGISLQGFNTSFNSNNTASVTGNASSTENIYGNNTYGYVWQSDFSKVVVHAGLLADGETGNVKVTAISNKSSFPASLSNNIQSLGYDGDSCAIILEKVTVVAGPGPVVGPCSPVDFINCCPPVFTSAVMNASTRYDTEAERLALGILPGTNFSSDGVLPVSFAYSLSSATGTADEKSAKAYESYPIGNNTDGYAWGTKFGTALMHSGLITQGQTNQIFNVKVISLGPKESFIKGPDNNLIGSYPGNWKACAYKLELVMSGTTQPPGTTVPATTRAVTTTSTTPNIPVAPRITAFAVGSPSGIPTWTLTYFTNPSQILRVQLWVISGPSGLLNNGQGPAMTYPKKIWEKLLDSRQWTGIYATADSLKGYVRNTIIGGSNTFQLCAELSDDSRAKECTGYGGQTRYDGSRLTQHVTVWLA